MKVYLISEPRLDYAEFDRFIKDEGMPAGSAYHVEPASDAECLVELSARLCYMSYGKGRTTTKECLANIIRQKHFSVLEHANFTFIITGVSRSLTHELVRHRHLSFSQLSQRYVDESNAAMVIPEGIRHESPEVHLLWKAAVLEAQGAYKGLLDLLAAAPGTHVSTADKKWIRQCARSVLPNAIETKIAVTGNARAWLEFIGKRASPAADPEIRNLAACIYGILLAKYPSLFTPEEVE